MARTDRAPRHPHRRATPPRLVIVLLTWLVLAGACTASTGDGATDVGLENADGPSDTTTTRSCAPAPLAGDLPDLPADPTSAAIVASQAVFACADTVITATTETEALLAGVELAIAESAPLLLLDDASERRVLTEIERLAPDRVVFVASEDTLVSAPERAEVVVATSTIETPASALADRQPSVGANWIVAPGAEPAALAALPALQAGGGHVSTPDGAGTGPFDEPLAWRTIGDLDPTGRWELLRPLVADPLPGGGTVLFPGRRIVAFYGSPVTFRLGLLGEQGAQATVDRIAPRLERYQIDGGDPVIAGFELIATVADSKPGDDNDYSNELSPDELAPWIDVATANDVYVFIDLQPGRTDFLTQARRYEQFLRLPNVGLALDPEWRLEPDEEHLRQIGSVDAAEVNQVVDYLAELVRDENLPQKLLVLHQFQESMITNRELIRTPPELAVVVHVDGQGPLGTKYGTYNAMLDVPIGAEQTLWWGWKNFIDEDTPTATPDQVNAVEPLPVVITYQ